MEFYPSVSVRCFSSFFFFQAEDGIRDLTVTGVQTCALPICRSGRAAPRMGSGSAARDRAHRDHRRARRTLQQQPPGETDQRGRHPSPAGTLRAVALRLSQRRRGGQAAGARGAGRRDHGPGRADRAGGAARGVPMTLELQLFLLVWGTLVGLDLVSVPQMMIARPIVAGPAARAVPGGLAARPPPRGLFEVVPYYRLAVGAGP